MFTTKVVDIVVVVFEMKSSHQSEVNLLEGERARANPLKLFTYFTSKDKYKSMSLLVKNA